MAILKTRETFKKKKSLLTKLPSTTDTLPKTEWAHENRPSQKETSLPSIHFQVQTVKGWCLASLVEHLGSWESCLLPSLKLTFSHLKMDGWEMILSLSEGQFFRGYVCFRECIVGLKQLINQKRCRLCSQNGEFDKFDGIIAEISFTKIHPKIHPSIWGSTETRNPSKVMNQLGGSSQDLHAVSNHHFFKPRKGERGTTRSLGDLSTMVINHLLHGIILQEGCEVQSIVFLSLPPSSSRLSLASLALWVLMVSAFASDSATSWAQYLMA